MHIIIYNAYHHPTSDPGLGSHFDLQTISARGGKAAACQGPQ